MNDIPYMDIQEEESIHQVRLALQSGWFLLEIYKRKRQVQYSDPPEFEEYPVFIVANSKEG